MDLIPLIFLIISIVLPIYSARSLYKFIKWNREYNRQRKERDKAFKLRIHLIDNRIEHKECVCTPECLKQTKDMRLDILLPPRLLPRLTLTRERFGTPTASLATWIRPTQFMSEASFGAP